MRGSGSEPETSSGSRELSIDVLPPYVRKFGAGERPARVKQDVDRHLREIADAIWVKLGSLGLEAPPRSRRSR